MKSDITRDTFCKSKHYRMVNMQQGRVQVDADWNEQNNIQFHYEKEYLKDLIGKTGTLAKDNGFAISLSGSEFQIAKGHYYVDGILCENEKTVEYSKQDDVLDDVLQPSTFVDASYLVYLDVWERHITHLDDPYIREQALGNVDTATRTKIVWQVRTINASGLGNDKCKIWENALQKIDQHTTATVEARAKPSPESQDRCSLYETAGYTRLENQLYRIEVHDSGTLAKATLKYSRENGSVVSRITKYESGNRLIIAKRGKDEQLDFKIDDWVEITDDLNELHAVPGTLAKLTKVDDMTIEYSNVLGKTIGEVNYPLSRNPKMRRWESIKEGANPFINSGTPDSEGYVELEDGVQVRLGNGSYSSGDYWIVPARTRQGKVEWPTDTNDKPIALGPAGIAHHYAPLALLDYNKTNKKFYEKDLRSFFSSLTELVGIHYAGGDGQQALPDNKLPAPLCVSVTLGDRPISNTPMSGVTVKFTIVKESKSTPGSLRALPDGQPKQKTPVDVPVSAEGVAECEWILGDNMQDQQVKAELYNECASKIDVPPVYFHASLPISFYYIEGDGIEGTEGETVHLRAGVALGTRPLSANYRVNFTMVEGADTLSSHEEAPSTGIVHVTMTMLGQKQQVMAELLYRRSDSDPFLPTNLPPVYFNVALRARSNANSGIVLLKMPTEFTRPLIFGPFEHTSEHTLTKLTVPPMVYLGIPLLGGKDKEAVIFMEDFPGSYILFKPIIVTTTQFYILIAKSILKDGTGSSAELVKLLQSTVKRRRRPDSTTLKAIMTSDIEVAARAFRPRDISTIAALTAHTSTIPPTVPLAFPEELMIRWWAVPSEHTGGEQSSGPINLEGKLPTISFDKGAYSLEQNVTVIAVNPIPPTSASDMRRTIPVILTAGKIPEEVLTAGQIPKGLVLKLEETQANSSVFQKEFVLADITTEGVVIKIDDGKQTIPGLKIGEQFNVVWKYKQKKIVLDTAIFQ